MSKERIKNVNFVNLVESHPCLYNNTLTSYNYIDMKERAWQDISKETGDPVNLCKERWKNLRTVFLRHINRRNSTNEMVFKRKYYLEDSMQFILPFLKSSKQQKGYLEASSTMEEGASEDISDDCLDVGLMEDSDIKKSDTNNDNKLDLSDTQPCGTSDSTACFRKEIDNLYSNCSIKKEENDEQFSYFETANNTSSFDTECADQKFLLSLLPDMKLMNLKQKRKCKREFLTVIDSILES